MTWLSRDEEIRAIAAKISLQYEGVVLAGYASSGKYPTDIVILETAPTIEYYIKTGILPEARVVLRTVEGVK